MSDEIGKIIKVIIGTLCLGTGIYIAGILLIATPIDTGTLIAGIILAVVLILVGLFLLALGFWEEKIMKSMYGDFSNRNHWGR